MNEVIRSSPATGVVLSRGVDGRYAVHHGDEHIVTTAVLNLALAEYEEAVHRLRAAGREALAREQTHFDLVALAAESSRQKRARATRKGGKGRF